MSSPILGIHHVTAIAASPQANVDFYAGLLGMRLIKKTVNFDDPSTYHLYYGDGVGSPGSILTSFPWPGARAGMLGAGQTRTTAFAVPVDSLVFWRRRLTEAGVPADDVQRFGTSALAFADHDGLRLELVASVSDGDERPAWAGSSVPVEKAIHGFESVTLLEADADVTAELLEGVLGFRQVAADGRRRRFESGDGGSGSYVDLLYDPSAQHGQVAAGSVHHVAFRVKDDEAQTQWQDQLFESGHPTTEVKDRMYFRSIYFREPGGVLFELATDGPGFATDESTDELGSGLRLPPWFESVRQRIEQELPTLKGPRFEFHSEPGQPATKEDP